MNVLTGLLTLSGTGTQQYTGLPFLPKLIMVEYSAKGSSQNLQHHSSGSCDDSMSQVHIADYDDGTNRRCWPPTTGFIKHYDRVSGAYVAVVDAEVVSFDNNGGGDYGFTLYQNAADIDYTGKWIIIGD